MTAIGGSAFSNFILEGNCCLHVANKEGEKGSWSQPSDETDLF